jgi:hypothetical protein
MRLKAALSARVKYNNKKTDKNKNKKYHCYVVTIKDKTAIFSARRRY